MSTIYVHGVKLKQCYYCKNVFPKRKLTIDHKIPRARGGIGLKYNTVRACESCNKKKANMTDTEFETWKKNGCPDWYVYTYGIEEIARERTKTLAEYLSSTSSIQQKKIKKFKKRMQDLKKKYILGECKEFRVRLVNIKYK